MITEQAKYEQVWALGNYGNFSPGEQMLPLFRQMVRKKGGLIDIGCGCARATKQIEDDGHKVLGLDFVDARETDVPFKQHDITKPFNRVANVGYCCDVMEHIPPDDVNTVLDNIMRAVDRCFFSISFTQDHFGQHIGHALHLTVMPFEAWRTLLASYGEVVDARDLIGTGVFLVRGK